MSDRSFSAGWVVAIALWTVGVLLMAGAVVVVWELVAAGVTVLMLALAATDRQFHVQQSRVMRNAFELGRDVERRNVTPMGR